MAADGNTIVVGATGDDDYGTNSGSVYVYKWIDAFWDETKIIPSDGNESDKFGYSVAVSSDGNNIIVGASDDDDNGMLSGSAYLYRWKETSWYEMKITASDCDSYDHFGYGVSMSSDGNSFVVGTKTTESVYVFSW